MRRVPLELLTPDMRLGKPVCSGTSVLIREGTVNLGRYVRRLQSLGIGSLYIEDGACEGIAIEDLITEQTRMRCKKTLETSYMKLKSNMAIDRRAIQCAVRDLLDEIVGHPNTLISLNEIGSIEDNTLDHSVNTTIYAVCLGIELGYSRDWMIELAEGTLLHDIGKTALDSQILFKPGPLDPMEFEHIKRHAQLGYEILARDKGMPEVSKRIALCHHERMDGSGYPYGKTGNELDEFSKIAAIVDVYEALTVDRCYRKALSPQMAMEILSQEAVDKLDFNLSFAFMKNIAVYPNGTTVYLSTGEYAVVKEQNQSLPQRPIVRVITMENGKYVSKKEVDLTKVLNVTIIDPREFQHNEDSIG